MLYRPFLIFCFCCIAFYTKAQTGWKLLKEENGISVFGSINGPSKFKSIRVACTLDGTYEKLIKILTDVPRHKEWVYKTKETKLLQTISPATIIYHSETAMPWPIENRDAVIQMVVYKENLPRFLKVTATSMPEALPKQKGKIRIPSLAVTWQVTAKEENKIYIEYVLEVNPGGSLPAWVVNMYADKGPYESFKKLAELLKK